MNGFLPDGGIALNAGRIKFPQQLTLTSLSLDQPLLKWEAGKTLVGIDLFGYLFSLVIPLTDDQIRAHLEQHEMLSLHRFVVGPLERSATTGERFRALFCSVVRRD